MILSKANLIAVKVAHADPFERGLNGLHVEAGGTTVAGNGRAWMAVSPAREELARFPDVGEAAAPPQGGHVLPVDFAEEVLRNIPRDKKRPFLQYAAMTRGHDPRKVELTTVSETGREKRIAEAPKREPYVRWREVARKVHGELGDAATRVCIDRQQLVALLQAMDEAAPDRSGKNPVFIEVGGGRGVVLRCRNQDTGQDILGIAVAHGVQGWPEHSAWEKEALVEGGETGLEVPKKVEGTPENPRPAAPRRVR